MFLEATNNTEYYIAKCHPAYAGYLLNSRNSTPIPKSSNEFLSQLSSPDFKSVIPTLLDSILFHIQFTKGQTSITKLQQRYQCKAFVIENSFKEVLGLSFTQYQSLFTDSKN